MSEDALLTTGQAAKLLGISSSSLCKRRVLGDSPPFLKLGRSVRYQKGDLFEWARLRLKRSTSDPGHSVSGKPRR